MQTSFLKSLDAGLYRGACLVSSLLPKPARPLSDGVLILRPGGMGDLICADMALQELSLDARNFTWLIERRSRPWAAFRGLPHVCYDGQPLKALHKVRGRFSTVINTEQLYGFAEAYALQARAKGGRLFSFDTNRGSAWSDATVAYDWKDRHETVEFARLFAIALGRPDPGFARLPRPRIQPGDATPLVLIAGRQQRSRRMDVETWAVLITAWHQGRAFLIASAPEDAEFAAELMRRFGGQAGCFTASFAELCERISRSAEVFTMDGGAVHIASYFGVSALAVFSSGRDRKWRPLGEGSRVLRRRDLPCQPCTKFGQVPPCPYGYACLNLRDVAATAASG